MSWTPGDRRLALFVAASLLLHLLLGLGWRFDSGLRPAQAPASITARLAPAGDPLVQGVLALAEARDGLLEMPGEGMAGDAPAASPAPAVAAAAAPAPTREPVDPVVEAPLSVPAPGVERSGAVDLNWYAERDLDVLPVPLGPIDPLFPLNAQIRGVSGKVTVSVSIDPAGRVVDVSVVSADPPGFFEDSARAAFRAATYSPGIKDGRAVHAKIGVTVRFQAASMLPR